MSSMNMKEAVLELLLVNAQGIGHTNLIGKPAYYVIVEFGNYVYRSKISTGEDDNKPRWNEKFMFKFPLSHWKRLTHLKIKIMNKELFAYHGFVGETTIYLGGIISEGCERGLIEVKPAPYNVVLEDDTYKGEIKIGFKFIADKEMPKTPREYIVEENKHVVACLNTNTNSIVKLWRALWWWSLFLHKRMDQTK